jgi:DNA-binding MurR/RpiR family transcriptional regulator
MADENIFDKLTYKYYQLTSAEKRIADCLFAKGLSAQSMSIKELAEASGAAEATISRFCRRLGYEGYGAFRRAIASSSVHSQERISSPFYGEVTASDTVEEVGRKLAAANISAIEETQELLTPESIQAAAAILRGADKVLCMGQGGSMLLAKEAANIFGTVFSNFFPVSDSHTQIISATQLTERDVILYFSYSGSTIDLMDILPVAASRGAKVILVTRYPNSPGAAKADVVLQCGTTESPLQLGSVPARVAQLYLIDVLFSEVCRWDMEVCKARRARVADALSEKHV